MALDSWLTKVRAAVSSGLAASASPGKKQIVGILAFELVGLMSKLLNLWRALSDASLARLRRDFRSAVVVSDEDAFLAKIACAEFVDMLRSAADAIAVFSSRCADASLREFAPAFAEFADAGRDRHRWAMSAKEMEAKARKMEKLVAGVAAVQRAMDELSEAELSLRKMLNAGGERGQRRSLSASKISALADQQQQIFEKKQEVKYLKQTSLWSCSFDAVVSLTARSAFTTLARVKQVFAAGEDGSSPFMNSTRLHRSLTMSATVHPSSESSPPSPPPQPARKSLPSSPANDSVAGFLESNAAALVPPESTLGAEALGLRYANLIIAVERMVRTPRAVGPDARDNLYGMLTASLRQQLRSRLRDVGAAAATDAALAAQWRTALTGILHWLAPVAHATVRWQAERSFERRRPASSAAAAERDDVLAGGGAVTTVAQTLHFAATAKVDAAVVEMLVGLNYVWRFEREMNARALQLLHQELDGHPVAVAGEGLDDGGGGSSPAMEQ